jgi:hypothetical protein
MGARLIGPANPAWRNAKLVGDGKRKNHKDVMHIRLFNAKNRPVVVNCETDDGLITEGFS